MHVKHSSFELVRATLATQLPDPSWVEIGHMMYRAPHQLLHLSHPGAVSVPVAMEPNRLHLQEFFPRNQTRSVVRSVKMNILGFGDLMLSGSQAAFTTSGRLSCSLPMDSSCTSRRELCSCTIESQWMHKAIEKLPNNKAERVP